MDIKLVFPRIKYHEKAAPEGIVVTDADHERRLGAGWVETPADFGKDQESDPEPEPEPEETPAEMLARIDAVLHHQVPPPPKKVMKRGRL